MPLSPRTPVLVGAAAVSQRPGNWEKALEPVELMLAALEGAAADAGTRNVLGRADSIRVPRGTWDYSDPGRLLAQRLGAPLARTELAELGVLQTTLLGGAARDIAEGRADVVLVAGGEAKHRALRAQLEGREAPLTRQTDATPDRVLRPHAPILSELEMRRGIAMPVGQYAMIENALRAAEGLSLEAHARAVAELWSGMSEVAATNPDAWSQDPVDADSIRTASPGNRMLAFPYTKLHNSQWNVDQAAGLIFCSAETARSLGVPRERWVFPRAVAESNAMLPLTQRRALHRCPGFARAAPRALERAGLDLGEIGYLELYSCFPVAVRVQAREMTIDAGRSPTVTGGMAFAGGPLNNFVLQALTRMAQVLREDPGSAGLVTAVSGMLTKQGVSLWSTDPGSGRFGFDDVSQETERDIERVDVVAEAEGDARVASYTVLHQGETPSATVFLCDLADGRRALVGSRDAAIAETATREELCGRAVRLGRGGCAAFG